MGPFGMRIEASERSAAFAGAWTVFGIIPFEIWMNQHKAASVLEHNLLWLATAVVFFFVPVYFLVIGAGNAAFSRTWFLDQAERARYGVIARRMLIWFVSAAIVGVVWSAVLGLFLQSS